MKKNHDEGGKNLNCISRTCNQSCPSLNSMYIISSVLSVCEGGGEKKKMMPRRSESDDDKEESEEEEKEEMDQQDDRSSG